MSMLEHETLAFLGLDVAELVVAASPQDLERGYTEASFPQRRAAAVVFAGRGGCCWGPHLAAVECRP